MFLMMLFKHKSRIFALNICMVSFALLPLLSCTATSQNGKSSSGQFLAENSMMKKRLSLIERESDVLKKESQQHRTKIQELETENKQLSVELTSLNEKYLSDMADAEEQIDYLQQTITKIEKENSDHIDELLAENKALGEKRSRENLAFQEQIAKQKATFNQERELKMQESARRELNLSTQLNALDKKIAEKELEISTLKQAVSDLSAKLDAANALAKKLTNDRAAALAELESVKAASKITAETNSLELESIKADNAALNKKIAELNSASGK